MQARTPGKNGEATERPDERSLRGGPSAACGRANNSIAQSQRADKLALLPMKLLRFTDVRERTGLSRSTVWRLERRAEFPKHIKVSANIVAWLEEDVVEWIQSRARGLVG